MTRRFRWDGQLGEPYRFRASDRSRGGTWSRTAKAHKDCHPQCAGCGTVANLETDHIVPLHRGGTNAWTNLQSLCTLCHAAKTAREAGRSPP